MRSAMISQFQFAILSRLFRFAKWKFMENSILLKPRPSNVRHVNHKRLTTASVVKRERIWHHYICYEFCRILHNSLFTDDLRKTASVISCRSSHRRCSVKKGALKNIPKLTGRHLHCSPFLKRDLSKGVFQWNFRNFWEHLF